LDAGEAPERERDAALVFIQHADGAEQQQPDQNEDDDTETHAFLLVDWKKSPAAIFSRPYTGAGGKKRGFCRLPFRAATRGPLHGARPCVRAMPLRTLIKPVPPRAAVLRRARCALPGLCAPVRGTSRSTARRRSARCPCR